MKCTTFLFAIIAVSLTYSQSNQNVINNSGQAFAKAGNALSAYGSPVAVFFNPDTKTEGSVHLFENWNNFGIIHTTGLKKFSLHNINLNIERNVFESKISEDSIFTFNFENIDKIVINDHIFKMYSYDNHNRVFEVIYESGKVTLLKGYKIQLIKGSPNPMLNRSTDKNIQKEFYFIKLDNSIKPFKFNKSNILGLMSPEQAKVAKTYAKKNELSFNEDLDVNRILTQGFSN